MQILRKMSIFSGNFTKTFRFFQANLITIFEAISQKFRFPFKNWPLTAASEQIILFLYKSHHFRTYFLYMIRYNISRPPTQNLGVATPQPSQD